MNNEVKILDNGGIEAFYKQKALAVYESLLPLKDHMPDEFAIAEMELKKEGLSIPKQVEPVKGIVSYRRSIANEYAGHWILFECATGIPMHKVSLEQEDFVELCKEVAQKNEFFLGHALGKTINAKGALT